VSPADYEAVFIPIVESRLKRLDKLRLLYRLGHEFKGFTAGAMSDERISALPIGRP